MTESKLILVIGATGAQGRPIVKSITEDRDGVESPWRVRAMTRDLKGKRALEIAANPKVEMFEGSFTKDEDIIAAVEGCYGIFVNTDTYVVGQKWELHLGIRIFEICRRLGTVKHLIYSSLTYGAHFGDKFRTDHHDGKSRVAQWMSAQPSPATQYEIDGTPIGDGMIHSVLTTAAYMDMLEALFAPHNIREDGTRVFASPIEDGRVCMVALSDVGWWTRWMFDHPDECSGKDISVASEYVGWDKLVETFTRVTGHKAVFLRQSHDDWFKNFSNADKQLGGWITDGTTWRENFTGFWNLWKYDVVKKDMDWLKKIHPNTMTLEKWMIDTKYDGHRTLLLNHTADDTGVRLNKEVCATL